jgi:hypothetical protein
LPITWPPRAICAIIAAAAAGSGCTSTCDLAVSGAALEAALAGSDCGSDCGACGDGTDAGGTIGCSAAAAWVAEALMAAATWANAPQPSAWSGATGAPTAVDSMSGPVTEAGCTASGLARLARVVAVRRRLTMALVARRWTSSRSSSVAKAKAAGLISR